jgi:hypothetical protein
MPITSEIDEIYNATRLKFTEWGESEQLSYRNAACAETLRGGYEDSNIPVGPSKLGDPVGFQILWTPIRHKPKILICGLCPASFGSREDNVKFLKGDIPSENIYFNASHTFGTELTGAFTECGREDLFHDCVGLNLWHFQYIDPVRSNPYADEVRLFCEKQTIKIIELVEPEFILALGDKSFSQLQKAFEAKVHQFEHPSDLKNFRKHLKLFITENFS